MDEGMIELTALLTTMEIWGRVFQIAFTLTALALMVACLYVAYNDFNEESKQKAKDNLAARREARAQLRAENARAAIAKLNK